MNDFYLIYGLPELEWCYGLSTQCSDLNYFLPIFVFPLPKDIKISTSYHHLGVQTKAQTLVPFILICTCREVREHQRYFFFLLLCAIISVLLYFYFFHQKSKGASIFSRVIMTGTLRSLENILGYTLDIKILVEKKL